MRLQDSIDYCNSRRCCANPGFFDGRHDGGNRLRPIEGSGSATTRRAAGAALATITATYWPICGWCWMIGGYEVSSGQPARAEAFGAGDMGRYADRLGPQWAPWLLSGAIGDWATRGDQRAERPRQGLSVQDAPWNQAGETVVLERMRDDDGVMRGRMQARTARSA